MEGSQRKAVCQAWGGGGSWGWENFATSMNPEACCYFLVGSGWFLIFPGWLWMVPLIFCSAPDGS